MCLKFILLCLCVGHFPLRLMGLFPHCKRANSEYPNESVKFYYYSRDHPNGKYLNETSLNEIPFINNTFYVILHGYTGSKDGKPNPEIRTALLDHNDCNIISPDYSSLVTQWCYFQAVDNVEPIAEVIALFVDNLINSKIVTLNNLEIIAFSLGSQIAGSISNYNKNGPIKRIIALDPAQPLFLSKSNQHRLDKNDAEFVMVIHTDILMHGFIYESGDVDFYMNGGFFQPGCHKTKSNDYFLFGCNHYRAVQYLEEAIKSPVPFRGYPCSFNSWFNRKCKANGPWIPMGLNTPNNVTGYHVVFTNNNKPFAINMENQEDQMITNIQLENEIISELEESTETFSVYGIDVNISYTLK